MMGRRSGELQAPVEIGEEVRVSQRAEELSPVEFGQGFQEGAQGGELDAEENDESGVEGPRLGKDVVVHERKCLMRIQGLLERAGIPPAAIIPAKISTLVRSHGIARTGRGRSDTGPSASFAPSEESRTKFLSIQGFLTPHLAARSAARTIPQNSLRSTAPFEAFSTIAA
jgi:hypothetical protein